MELKRAVLSRRNTAKLCGMKLYLRRVTHSQAHDNYRVPRDNQDETAATIWMRLCRGWPAGARA